MWFFGKEEQFNLDCTRNNQINEDIDWNDISFSNKFSIFIINASHRKVHRLLIDDVDRLLIDDVATNGTKVNFLFIF